MKAHIQRERMEQVGDGGVALSVPARVGLVKRVQATMSPRRKRLFSSENLTGYLFILPAIVGFSVFVIYPLVAACYYAMTDWNGLTDPRFIGLKNFLYMFTKDPAFLPSLEATGLYALLTVPTALVLGLGLALLVNRNLPGIKLIRTILYLPVVLPSIAALTLWKFVYNPQVGLANQVLSWLHLPTSLWLSSAQTALPSIAIIALWRVGSTMIIFLAALQAVPQELYEAGKIDGTGPLSAFKSITLPMITPIIFLQLILQLIQSLQTFNEPQVLSNNTGGPHFSTDLLMYSIYKNGFGNLGQFPQLGYATAQALVLFVLIMIITAFTFRFSTLWVYAENGEDA